jgi:prolyl-tRNA synthetase
LREAPAEAEVTSHRLLLRAGFIRQLAAGVFSYLPLARKAMTKIEDIMREEIDALGGQEITMPVVHPGDLWKETGRWYSIGAEMGRFVEKSGRDMALAMTHEEVVTDLTRKEIKSYRQLPQLVYHIQTKWRDDPRPRAGLIRAREFTMLDSYSLDMDEAGLDKQYRAHYQAYFRIFGRCGLPTIAVKSDVGMMGGSMAHEYMYLTPIGEDTLVLCDNCGYSANRQVATFRKKAAHQEEEKEMEKVATPGVTTIDALAQFLGIDKAQTAKAVFMVAKVSDGEQGEREQFVFAVVRGDMDVNETKLANVVKANELRPAQEEEITSRGAQPGYGSPIGVRDALIVVDDAVVGSTNLVAGANEVGYHYINVNYGRDYKADVVADIAAASEGDECPVCGEALRLSRGVEAGNIFKLGTRYTDALEAVYLDKDGKQKSVIMGSYGIGVGRLLACVAEEHNDERGLVWPITISPYHVHMVSLAREGEAHEAAEKLYTQMQAAGLEVLYDDREGSAGVKFNDADLIGIPLRVTVGERSLAQGGVEMKRRDVKESRVVELGEVVQVLKGEIKALEQEIAGKVVEVPFEG